MLKKWSCHTTAPAPRLPHAKSARLCDRIGVRWLTIDPPYTELVSPRTFVQRHKQVTPVYNRIPITVLYVAAWRGDASQCLRRGHDENKLAQPLSAFSVMFWLVVVPEKEFHQYHCGSWLRSAVVQSMKNRDDQSAKHNGNAMHTARVSLSRCGKVYHIARTLGEPSDQKQLDPQVQKSCCFCSSLL